MNKLKSPPKLCLSDSAIEAALPLFHQQLWFWGQDVLHRRGNALLAYGFKRHPPPPKQDAVSIYRLELPRGRRVVLRGFGMFYSDARLGGIFLNRFEFVPEWSAQLDLPANAWHSPKLPDLRVPTDAPCRRKARALTAGAVRWMADYEAWARAELGRSHRQAAAKAWRAMGHPSTAADGLAEAWREWLVKWLTPLRGDSTSDGNKTVRQYGLVEHR